MKFFIHISPASLQKFIRGEKVVVGDGDNRILVELDPGEVVFETTAQEGGLGPGSVEVTAHLV